MNYNLKIFITTVQQNYRYYTDCFSVFTNGLQ
jgi:hypothetical protein